MSGSILREGYKITNEPEFNIPIDFRTPNKIELIGEEDLTDIEAQRAVDEYFKTKVSKSSGKVLQKNKPNSNGILPLIFDSLEKQDKNSIYFSLSKAGYICSGNEFLKEEI